MKLLCGQLVLNLIEKEPCNCLVQHKQEKKTKFKRKRIDFSSAPCK